MRDVKQPLGGAVVVTVDSGTVGRLDVEVLWAHTTDSMCLGYMSTTDQQAKVRSTLSVFALHMYAGWHVCRVGKKTDDRLLFQFRPLFDALYLQFSFTRILLVQNDVIILCLPM